MQYGTHQVTGDLLALAGALSVAVYMVIGRRLRKQLTMLGYVFPVYGIAAIALMVLAIQTGTKLSGFSSFAWLWLGLLALVPQVIGHSSFNWALGHLDATHVALVVLAEPVGSITLAWLTLGEIPAVSALLGGVLILTGISIATRNKA